MAKKKQVKEKEPKFVLEMSASQGEVLVRALDFFSRIGIGQIEEVETMLRQYGHLKEGYSYDAVKNALDFVKLETMGHPPGGSYGIFHQKVPDWFKLAWDLQQVIRHKLAWTANPEGGFGVNFHEPMKAGKEPLATMEVLKDEPTDVS
jgi:hypothetical protein